MSTEKGRSGENRSQKGIQEFEEFLSYSLRDFHSQPSKNLVERETADLSETCCFSVQKKKQQLVKNKH